MDQAVTRKDIEELRLSLLKDIEKLLTINARQKNIHDFEWLRSKTVRQIMNISAGTLQNLRVQKKIRFKKILGSYYYNKQDLLHLFSNDL